MSSRTKALQGVLSNYITEIRRLFKGRHEVTIVVRNPDDENGGVMIGNDDPELVIAEIRRLNDPTRDNERLPARKP